MGQAERSQLGTSVPEPSPTKSGDPAPDESPRRSWHRPRLSATERREAMEALMLQPTVPSLRRFSVLMSLSVVVAAVGLLQDSTAVVVGAMLIAPLMSPIMGLAASLVMGWGRRLLTGASVVVMSMAGAVAIAWVMAVFLPEAGTGLPSEIVSRSSPDVRDLLIALAAGTAGAYATIRTDVSGALPGVAVAVALVPPLASIGLLLGRGQPDLAAGAALLYATNLFGIVLAAAIVFVATGFVPPHRFRNSRHAITVAFAIMIVPILVVGTILTQRFLATVDRAHELRVATEIVLDWLGPTADLNRVALSDTTLQVNMASEIPPPKVQTLTDALREELGHPITVDLRWTPISNPADETTVPVLALDELRPVVEEWLTDQSLTLDGLSYDVDTLVVQSSGPQPPHSSDELTQLITDRLGSGPAVSLAWIRTSADEDTTDEQAQIRTARTVVDNWATEHPKVTVLTVRRADPGITVTLTAPDSPEVDDLRTRLEAALPQTAVSVQWVPSSVLVTTASSGT
jgi:uncharacterized hydrophobic protein (TIGR00271 family)